MSESDNVDDPKKADLVTDDVSDFFKTLESIDSPIFQQARGSMTYQKDVESVQIGLIILGYDLPIHGVDGLFGPETARAVNKFKSDNDIKDDDWDINKNINEAMLMSPINLQGVNSAFGVKRSYETHPGVDLKANSGTEIKSPADGKVIDARFKSGACGGTIQIQHADGFKSRYCHCKDIRVSIGQEVKQGEIIGLSGGGPNDKGKGNSRGAHLHFELKKDGKLVNPLDYINKDIGTIDSEKTKISSDKAYVTPEMVDIMIKKLKEKDIKSADLKKYLDNQISISGLTDQNFYKKLLENIGAPVSEENLKFLYAWRQAEGGKATFNPFNTTHKMKNATNYNKVGVKNYETLEDGLIATIKTLKNGRYGCILDGLKKDIGADKISQCYSDLKTWGTGYLVNQVVNKYNRGIDPRVPPIYVA